MLELVVRNGRIDHPIGGRDDLANAVAGVVHLATGRHSAPLQIWGGSEVLTVWGR